MRVRPLVRLVFAAAVVTALAVPGLAQERAAATTQEIPDYPRVLLTAGRSTVMTTAFDITRIAVTNPAIADAVVVQPREVLIDGKGPGTVSLIIWGGGQRIQYDVVVDPGVPGLQQTMEQLFPGEDIRVALNDDAIILSGRASSNAVMLKAGEIATGAFPKGRLINLLELPGGSESQQVMLQVRVAEVNSRAIKELGANFFLAKPNWLGRVTTQQFGGANFDDDSVVLNDLLNIFLYYRKEGLGVLIKALEQKGLFQSLAEPNLIAYNGQEASFLAGGEFPIPVVQGATGTVTIVFKEFGVRLTFRPTIAGDVIRLKVRPEVSALDFNNGITLEGFRIPALITRRAETDIELRDGQSFAIAGLLNNTSQADGANVPFLSQIPIIGTLFKSKADRKERTELMVLVTPRLVRPLDPDEVPPLPTMQREFLPGAPDTSPSVPAAPQVPESSDLR
jgi:pilus assembly protein CpaC